MKQVYQELPLPWRGSVAAVTGASSGIGAATARALALAGFKVALIARREARLKQLCAEIEEAGGSSFAYPLDLRDCEATGATLRLIGETLGPIRLLVNNAGLGHAAPLMRGDTEHWREMLELNILALCVCTREATQQMRSAGDWGHIIHISSMSAHRVPRGSGVYSATKFAVRSLTEGLRQELREEKSAIRVSALSPGFVETEFAAHYHRSEEVAREMYTQYQVLSAEDVANAVLYLVQQPAHVQIHDLLMRPTQQES